MGYDRAGDSRVSFFGRCGSYPGRYKTDEVEQAFMIKRNTLARRPCQRGGRAAFIPARPRGFLGCSRLLSSCHAWQRGIRWLGCEGGMRFERE
jgi:hypothetical protein